MKDIIISDDIIYIGADDKDIELFENQYNVPNGVAYNSYIIIDKKIAIMDTIDKRRTNQWLENLNQKKKKKNLNSPLVYIPGIEIFFFFKR